MIILRLKLRGRQKLEGGVYDQCTNSFLVGKVYRCVHKMMLRQKLCDAAGSLGWSLKAVYEVVLWWEGVGMCLYDDTSSKTMRLIRESLRLVYEIIL